MAVLTCGRSKKTFAHWIVGKEPWGEAEPRPGLTFQVVRTLLDLDPPRLVAGVAGWTVGNRFADRQTILSAFPSSQEISSFIETLARFRRDVSLLAERLQRFVHKLHGQQSPQARASDPRRTGRKKPKSKGRSSPS